MEERVNWFQRWVVDAVFQIFRQLRHIERKIDIVSQHLGATLPRDLLKAGEDLAKKTEALRVALDAQAHEKPTKEELNG
jgi:hypothetical protein